LVVWSVVPNIRSQTPAQRNAGAADPVEPPSSVLNRGEDGRLPIVGIRSSAGGFEALEKLLGAMPAGAGVALVVVAHLDRRRKAT
jgi:chemotaxis response regulator CheB